MPKKSRPKARYMDWKLAFYDKHTNELYEETLTHKSVRINIISAIGIGIFGLLYVLMGEKLMAKILYIVLAVVVAIVIYIMKT